MSFSFNAQISEKEYSIQINTDNYEQFLFIQEMARQCVDGKHKENHVEYEPPLNPVPEGFKLPDMGLANIPSCCRSCPNHPSNGGTGNCNCALPYLTSDTIHL